MRESKFRFRNPVLESMEFIVNEDFNEEQYEGIRISGKTQIAKGRVKLSLLTNDIIFDMENPKHVTEYT